jgi:hypothetical protein
MANTIQVTLDGQTPIRDIVDEMVYRSYSYNRQRAPDIKPEEWARIFPNGKALEVRYEADKAAATDKSHET